MRAKTHHDNHAHKYCIIFYIQRIQVLLKRESMYKQNNNIISSKSV